MFSIFRFIVTVTPTCEDKLCPSQDPGGEDCVAVVTPCVQAECGVSAHWVRIMPVVALPSAVVVVENKMAGEEEDPRADLTPLAYPLTL